MLYEVITRTSVEYQFGMCPNLVDVHQWDVVFPGIVGQDFGFNGVVVVRKGRCGNIYNQVASFLSQFGHRIGGVKLIFAKVSKQGLLVPKVV